MKLVLSGAALTALGNQPKLRVRTADMGDYIEFQVRPTDRASSVNIPKSEQLVDIATDGSVEIDESHSAALVDGQSFFVVQSRKHGWFCLTAVRPAGSNPPVVNRV